MPLWTCPACDRTFSRRHQTHLCVPPITLEESLAGRPPAHRQVYEALLADLATLGPVHAEVVRVGAFLRREDAKLAEVRWRARSVELWLWLPRSVDSDRVVKRVRVSAARTVHMIKLGGPEDVDEQVQDWLAEAYDAAG